MRGLYAGARGRTTPRRRPAPLSFRRLARPACSLCAVLRLAVCLCAPCRWRRCSGVLGGARFALRLCWSLSAASVGSAASRVLSVAAARPLPPRRRLPAPAPPAPVAPVGALCGSLSGGAGGSLWALLPPVAVVAAGAAPCRAARGAGGSALAARPLGLAALRAPPLRRSPVAAGGVASLLVLGRFALLLAMMGACCLPSPRCRSGPAPAQFLPAGLPAMIPGSRRGWVGGVSPTILCFLQR